MGSEEVTGEVAGKSMVLPASERHRQHRQHRLENGAVRWSPPTFTGPSRRDTWAVLPVWKLQQSEISISAVLQQQRVLPPQLLVQLQTEHNNNNNNDNNTETIFDRPVCRSMWSPTQQLQGGPTCKRRSDHLDGSRQRW